MGDGPKFGGKPYKSEEQLKRELTRKISGERLKAAPGRKKEPPPPPSKSHIDQASPRAHQASIPKPDPLTSTPNTAKKTAQTRAERTKENAVAWDPRKIRMFVAGDITLGELSGVSKIKQYEIAEKGHAYLQQGKLDSAKRIFEGLSVLDPHDGYFQLALGAIAQRTGELEEAEHRYSRVLEINPHSPHAYANRGEVRVIQGRTVDGAKDLLRALEEDPESREPATRRARATLGVIQEQLDRAALKRG